MIAQPLSTAKESLIECALSHSAGHSPRQRRVVLSQIRVPVHPQTKPVFGALTSVHCPLLSTTLLQGFPMHSLISAAGSEVHVQESTLSKSGLGLA